MPSVERLESLNKPSTSAIAASNSPSCLLEPVQTPCPFPWPFTALLNCVNLLPKASTCLPQKPSFLPKKSSFLLLTFASFASVAQYSFCEEIAPSIFFFNSLYSFALVLTETFSRSNFEIKSGYSSLRFLRAVCHAAEPFSLFLITPKFVRIASSSCVDLSATSFKRSSAACALSHKSFKAEPSSITAVTTSIGAREAKAALTEAAALTAVAFIPRHAVPHAVALAVALACSVAAIFIALSLR